MHKQKAPKWPLIYCYMYIMYTLCVNFKYCLNVQIDLLWKKENLSWVQPRGMGVGGWGVLPEKLGGDMCSPLLKTLTLFMTKICDFPTLSTFMTWPKIQYPIYDRCGWRSCLKLKLWRAFVEVVIENEQKVASCKKHTQLKTRVLKPYSIYNQNGQNRYPIIFMTKMAEKPYPLRLHIPKYIAHIREYPSPPLRGSTEIEERKSLESG